MSNHHIMPHGYTCCIDPSILNLLQGVIFLLQQQILQNTTWSIEVYKISGRPRQCFIQAGFHEDIRRKSASINNISEHIAQSQSLKQTKCINHPTTIEGNFTLNQICCPRKHRMQKNVHLAYLHCAIII